MLIRLKKGFTLITMISLSACGTKINDAASPSSPEPKKTSAPVEEVAAATPEAPPEVQSEIPLEIPSPQQLEQLEKSDTGPIEAAIAPTGDEIAQDETPTPLPSIPQPQEPVKPAHTYQEWLAYFAGLRYAPNHPYLIYPSSVQASFIAQQAFVAGYELDEFNKTFQEVAKFIRDSNGNVLYWGPEHVTVTETLMRNKITVEQLLPHFYYYRIVKSQDAGFWNRPTLLYPYKLAYQVALVDVMRGVPIEEVQAAHTYFAFLQDQSDDDEWLFQGMRAMRLAREAITIPGFNVKVLERAVDEARVTKKVNGDWKYFGVEAVKKAFKDLKIEINLDEILRSSKTYY